MRWVRAWGDIHKFYLLDDGGSHAVISPTMNVEGKWLLQYNAEPSWDVANVWETVGVFDTLEEAQAMGKLIAAAQNP